MGRRRRKRAKLVRGRTYARIPAEPCVGAFARLPADRRLRSKVACPECHKRLLPANLFYPRGGEWVGACIPQH